MNNPLNFVLPYSQEHYPTDWCFSGPLHHTIKKIHSFTIFPTLKDGYDNYILIEPFNTINSMPENINKIIDGILLSEFIQKNNVDLIVSVVGDPFHQFYLDEFITTLKKLDIYHKTKILTSTMNVSDDIVFNFNFFIEESAQFHKNHTFHGQINQLGYITREIKEHELNNFRNKKFLCLNRNLDKEHRLSLLHDYLTNDFTDSYFTFLRFFDNEIHADAYQENQFHDSVYLDKLPIELDTNGNVDFGSSDTIKTELFLDSCINLITETSFDKNEIFLSEKVLKPILMFQPFIVFGPMGYLKELKNLGFKTFSDFWDESYDDIEDSKKRYFTLMNLILDLNKKSIKEFNELYQQTKDIVIYNNNNLKNINKDGISYFLNNFMR